MTIKHPLNESKDIKIFEAPIKGASYFGIVDVAEGVEGDSSVLIILKMPRNLKEDPYEVVFTFRSNDINIFQFQELIFEFASKYNEAYLLVEVNIHDIASSLYRDYEYDSLIKTSRVKQRITTTFFNKEKKFGVKTTEPIKKLGLEMLITQLEDNKIIINDLEIVKEFSTLVKSKKSFEAKRGAHDDMAMCMVLFGWALTQEGFKEIYDMEDFKNKIQNEYLDSAREELCSFFIEDGINQNF